MKVTVHRALDRCEMRPRYRLGNPGRSGRKEDVDDIVRIRRRAGKVGRGGKNFCPRRVLLAKHPRLALYVGRHDGARYLSLADFLVRPNDLARPSIAGGRYDEARLCDLHSFP